MRKKWFFKKNPIFAHFHFFQKKSKKWSKKPPPKIRPFFQGGQNAQNRHFGGRKWVILMILGVQMPIGRPKWPFLGVKKSKKPHFWPKNRFFAILPKSKKSKKPRFLPKNGFFFAISQNRTKTDTFWPFLRKKCNPQSLVHKMGSCHTIPSRKIRLKKSEFFGIFKWPPCFLVIFPDFQEWPRIGISENTLSGYGVKR